LPLSDDRIPVKRHRLEHAEIYELFGDELDRIEHEATNVGTDLQFATFWLSIAGTCSFALPTIPESNTRIFIVFLIVLILGYALGFYFAVRWWLQRGTLKKLIARIRQRQVGPIGEEGKELKPSDLAELPGTEPGPPREQTTREQTR
jgi:hypothetical protein